MKIGWIILNKEVGLFVESPAKFTHERKKALVFDTRNAAREAKLGKSEVVRKVELFENGKAKRILP
ncbi:MAG: hypothetical protein IMZ47_04240 [Firmicutes bacterium]|nr:hypothetical protein [Bacillota bacterium]